MDVYSPEARAEMADRIRLVATVGRIVLASIVELSMSYSMLHDMIQMTHCAAIEMSFHTMSDHTPQD